MDATINFEMSNFPVHLLNGHQNFINQVNDAIDRHIDDPELSISGLARELNMSRATLFRKLKA